ncbi:hypothetical protein [Streptococcus sobrinus]|uniref:hypothetical protein n=1 Tax=Streptococcus sobrinus TaxID=1310 RepID=UPI0003145588|nr:hypothetical protein [Streptococcus sobrinus]
MVFIGMPYSSWKVSSETEEERKERHRICQEKREQEKQVREKNIENDLKFAKENYGTTTIYTYPIPVDDLPMALKTSGAAIRINFADLIRYNYADNDFKAFYRTSRIVFPEESSRLRDLSNYLASLLNIPCDTAVEISSYLSTEEYIFSSILDSKLQLSELELNNELIYKEYHFQDPFYKKARNSILDRMNQAKNGTRFIKCWKNTRYWKKKGLSKESIFRLYAFVNYFYLTHDWDNLIYKKLF